jgi:hypothetical protein
MKDIYETLELEKISLSHLRNGDKELAMAMFKRFEEGSNYLSFKTSFFLSASPIFAYAKRLGKQPEETPLYKVGKDLATRLGIDQGYLVREEVVKREAAQRTPHQELTTVQVAEMAGCTPQAVRKAILTARLRARKVGRLALISEKDAAAFSQAIRHYGDKRQRRKGRRELAHA